MHMQRMTCRCVVMCELMRCGCLSADPCVDACDVNACLLHVHVVHILHMFPSPLSAARQRDKLGYRYPQGESYLDVIDRLEPVIFEIERAKGPILVVGHQAVLRCLFGYFLGRGMEQERRGCW